VVVARAGSVEYEAVDRQRLGSRPNRRDPVVERKCGFQTGEQQPPPALDTQPRQVVGGGREALDASSNSGIEAKRPSSWKRRPW
jgi:hypothetical protein